jgi:hypothetical protein
MAEVLAASGAKTPGVSALAHSKYARAASQIAQMPPPAGVGAVANACTVGHGRARCCRQWPDLLRGDGDFGACHTHPSPRTVLSGSRIADCGPGGAHFDNDFLIIDRVAAQFIWVGGGHCHRGQPRRFDQAFGGGGGLAGQHRLAMRRAMQRPQPPRVPVLQGHEAGGGARFMRAV